MSAENKAKLLEILSSWWYKKTPGPFTRLLLKDDGIAELYEGDKMTRRKLSAKGKEYLRTDGAVVRGQEEDFLEPE